MSVWRTGPACFEVQRGNTLYVFSRGKSLAKALQDVADFCDGKAVTPRGLHPLYVQRPLFEG